MRKKKIVKVEEPTAKFLTMEETLSLQLASKDIDLAKLEVELVQCSIDNLRLQISNTNLTRDKLANNLKGLSTKGLAFNDKVQSTRKEYLDLIKGLTKEYSLPNAWGFDPDSGEIKLDES